MSKRMCNSCNIPLELDKEGPACMFCPTCGFEVYDTPKVDDTTTTPTPKVKRLVWEQVFGENYEAEAPLFGRLGIQKYKDMFDVFWLVPGYVDAFIPDSFPTLEAAKAAAQAEYDKEMLACLELPVEGT